MARAIGTRRNIGMETLWLLLSMVLQFYRKQKTKIINKDIFKRHSVRHFRGRVHRNNSASGYNGGKEKGLMLVLFKLNIQLRPQHAAEIRKAVIYFCEFNINQAKKMTIYIVQGFLSFVGFRVLYFQLFEMKFSRLRLRDMKTNQDNCIIFRINATLVWMFSITL